MRRYLWATDMVDRDVLYNAACLALVEAVRDHDPERSGLATWARLRIHWSVYRRVEAEISIPRGIWSRRISVNRARDRIEAVACRRALPEEVAAELGVDKSTLESWEAEICASSPVSLDAPVWDEAGSEALVETIPGQDDSDVLEAVEDASTRRWLLSVLGRMSARPRMVLTAYYLGQMPTQAIAGALGISEVRVNRIRSDALVEARKLIRRDVRCPEVN